jgi:superfamily I DNA/RNA helicase
MPLESFGTWDFGLKLPKIERDNVARALKENLPEVYVDTIHSTKGLEFDHVFIFIDMPRPYMFSLEEKRVIYTGITRARQSLDYSYRGFYSEKYAL